MRILPYYRSEIRLRHNQIKFQGLGTRGLYLKLLLIQIFLLYVFFLLVYYPIVGNIFDYWHMARAINYENAHLIFAGDTNAGFYVLTVIISNVAGVSYSVIPTLPLQALPVLLGIIVFIGLLSRNDPNFLFALFFLPLVFLFRFGYQDVFTWWSHGVGFFLVLISLLLIDRCSQQNVPEQWRYHLLLILLISGINFISYKMTFYVIMLIIFYQVVIYVCGHFQRKKHIGRSYINTIFFGIIYVLTFNTMYYREFLPRLRMSSEVTSTSAEKLFSSFFLIPLTLLVNFTLKVRSI